MNKKIIALIMVVPFVFLYLMFTTSYVASIKMDVPVSGVKITNPLPSKTKVFDMATYQDDFFVAVQVLPTQAKNQGFETKIIAIEGEDKAELEVDEATGLVRPLTIGKSRIVVETNDGAYRDSIIAVVTSSKPLTLDVSMMDYKRDPVELSQTAGGWAANVQTGRYYIESTCAPQPAMVSYSSSDKNKAKVNAFAGFVDIVSSGEVVVTAQAEGAKGTLTQNIYLTATQIDSPTGITVNGSANQGIVVEKSSTTASCIVEARADLGGAPVLDGTDLPLLTSYMFTRIQDDSVDTHKYLLELFFGAGMPPSLNFDIKISGQIFNLSVDFGDFTFGLFQLPNYQLFEDAIIQHAGTTSDYFMLAQPEIEGVEYNWSSSSNNVNLSVENEKCTIMATAAGEATITVSALKDGQRMNVADEIFKILVVNSVNSAEFDLNGTEWGLAGYRALANKTIIANAYRDTDNADELDITVFSGTNAVETDLTQFEFSTSDAAIAEIRLTSGKPTLNIKGTGFVDLIVRWKYSRTTKPITSRARVECVKDGVYVGNHAELVKASEDGRKIVLKSNIMLGKQNATLAELESMTKTIKTTYNAQYYHNLGKDTPTVRYCIEFKNDVFGNGYSINGEYITKATDKTGVPLLFKGALCLAEVPNTVSVLGQDNIVFLIRTDGVVLDNLILMGCGDDAIMSEDDESQLDLSNLKLAGTVLEVMSDARVINSRIKNGRNVMRVYGGNADASGAMVEDISAVDVDKERINVSVESSILSQAREFLLKIGTNRVLSGSKAVNAPLLKVNGVEVEHTDDFVGDADFYNQLVLTDMTVRDCVFAKSGLFAVGLDSNYAGPAMLNDFRGELEGLNDRLIGWDKLGGTSFASYLRFEGDVRFYDWKPISAMDSSTIVETYGALAGILNIDLDALVNKAVDVSGDEYKDLIFVKDGQKYVNTSIFMFGGGKNYTQINFDAYSGEELPYYPINAEVLSIDEPEDSIIGRQGRLIPLVIGDESFQFYMFNKNSQNNYDNQLSDLNSGKAYGGIPTATK